MMSHPSTPVGQGFQATHAEIEAHRRAGEAASKESQDKIQYIFQQERHRLAEDTASYEEEQRKERIDFERQKAVQEQTSKAQCQAFSASLSVQQRKQQREEEAFQRSLASRKEQFQAQMQQRQEELDRRVQEHRAALSQSHPLPEASCQQPSSFQFPTPSQLSMPSAEQLFQSPPSSYTHSPYAERYGQDSSMNDGLETLPDFTLQNPQPSSYCAPHALSSKDAPPGRQTLATGGLEPLPELPTLPSLGDSFAGNPSQGQSEK